MITKTEKPPTTYSCKECGVPVTRERDEFVRGCECNGGIVASLHATAVGKSAFADETAH
jgi:hypothetical protein